MVIILMGVSGCGKTSIGKMLSNETGLPFYDGDDFHPEANIKKMGRGEALNDTDRQPWLEKLAENIFNWSIGNGAILACSALKEKYRHILINNRSGVHLIYLKGSFDLIFNRISNREGHYMKSELLRSQFDTLEEPVNAHIIDISLAPHEIISQIVAKIR